MARANSTTRKQDKNTKSAVNKNNASSASNSSRLKRSGSLQAAFQQHQATAVDSLLRLFTEATSSLLTCLVIGIALALPLALILLLQNFSHLGSGIDQNSTISLYMDKGIDEEALTATANNLSERADITEIVLITADAALAEFEAQSGFGDVLSGLDANPLPAVLLVTPVVSTAQEVSELQQFLQEQEGVELAQIDLQWLQRLNAMVSFAVRGAVILALLLSIGVILAIGNTLRMAIENRRAEIVVVKLVGGTDAYVARPFLYTGLWYGVGGGLAALLILYFSLFALKGPVSALLSAYNSDFVLRGMGISESFYLLLLAATLGWLGAWLSVVRHLRAIEPH